MLLRNEIITVIYESVAIQLNKFCCRNRNEYVSSLFKKRGCPSVLFDGQLNDYTGL